MTEHFANLDDRLRAVDPAQGLDRDPNSPCGHRIRNQAQRQPRSGAARAAMPRKRLVGLMAAVMALSGGVATASGIFQPDPADIRVFLDEHAEQAKSHIDGWRPELRAESVVCAYRDGTEVMVLASDFPLDEAMTAEHLVNACELGNDFVADLEQAPSGYTVCEGVIDPEEARFRLSAAELPDPSRTLPVVLGWNGPCADATTTATTDVALRPLTSLDDLNHLREIEVGLRAVAIERCLTHDEAWTMAEQTSDELDGEWPVISGEGRLLPGDRVSADDEGPLNEAGCHQVHLDELGVLIVR